MREIEALAPGVALVRQATRDEIPTAWVPRDRVRDVLAQIKRTLGYRMLYDLTAIDEQVEVLSDGRDVTAQAGISPPCPDGGAAIR